MKMLVTGGAGFIGSHVVEAAVRRGDRVRVLDSLRADVHPVGVVPQLPPGVELIRADVRDGAAVTEALLGVDLVCHQAAKVGLGVSFADAADYTDSNLTGTAVLLAAMTERGVARLVLASSMVVYGEGRYRGPDGHVRPPARAEADLRQGRFEPLDAEGRVLRPVLVGEDDALDPRNVYAASKLGQEHLASAWARASGGRAALLRYHNVLGAGMPQGTPYAGVASLFRSRLQRGEAPRVFEDGGQRRDFVDARDVATANLAAATWTGSVRDGTVRAFNIGSGEVHTIGDLATTLSAALDGPTPVITGEYRLGDVRHITADSSRARRELGWAPEHGFEGAVADFARAPLRAPAGPSTSATYPQIAASARSI